MADEADRLCINCQHVHKDNSERPDVWMCMLFPNKRPDMRAGGVRRPYQSISAVLRLSQPNDTLPCVLFEPLPEHGEAMVKETKGGKSVTYKEKETTK